MSGNHMQYLDIEGMAAWAEEVMASRKPDFVIGDNYMRRWWIIPRNALFNVYLHEINHDDDDRALHDHPWVNTSVLLKGSYREITPEGEFVRKPGEIIRREASAPHRLEVVEGPVISLFITGPTEREWGFHCPQGWKHWKDFTAFRQTGDSGQTGPGCGD